jgi:hypothetical protein
MRGVLLLLVGLLVLVSAQSDPPPDDGGVDMREVEAAADACVDLADGDNCFYDLDDGDGVKCGSCALQGSSLSCENVESCVNGARLECTKHDTINGFGIVTACGNSEFYDDGELVEPLELSSVDGQLNVTLTVRAARVDLKMFSMTTRLYCYEGDCTHPGPTIRCKGGDTVRLTLINELEGEVMFPHKAENTFRTPNITNIHTHGPHMDPAMDSIFDEVEPGHSHTYAYEIPSNHAPGVHWYHSHHHGASALQVMGGLLGAFIVDFPEFQTPPEALSAMEEHLLVLTHVSACTCNPTNDPFRIVDYMEIHDGTLSQLDPDFDFVGDIMDVYMTNGQYQPSLTIQPGEWHRLDVINAVGDAYLDLEIRTEIDGGNTVLFLPSPLPTALFLMSFKPMLMSQTILCCVSSV